MVPAALAGGLCIQSIAVTPDGVVLEATGAGASGRCPACGWSSTAVHDHYRRRPLDLPWRGHRVRLAVTVRRFRYQNHACGRRTFAETFGAGLPARSQRTAGVTDLLLQVALPRAVKPGPGWHARAECRSAQIPS